MSLTGMFLARLAGDKARLVQPRGENASFCAYSPRPVSGGPALVPLSQRCGCRGQCADTRSDARSNPGPPARTASPRGALRVTGRAGEPPPPAAAISPTAPQKNIKIPSLLSTTFIHILIPAARSALGRAPGSARGTEVTLEALAAQTSTAPAFPRVLPSCSLAGGRVAGSGNGGDTACAGDLPARPRLWEPVDFYL